MTAHNIIPQRTVIVIRDRESGHLCHFLARAVARDGTIEVWVGYIGYTPIEAYYHESEVIESYPARRMAGAQQRRRAA